MSKFDFNKAFGFKSTEDAEVTNKTVEIHGTEPGKKVLDKAVSIDDNKDKTKINKLDIAENLEKDVEKQKQTAGMVLLPLFRFESKEKPSYISYLQTIVENAKKLRKEDKYQKLLKYMVIMSKDDIDHKVNMIIERNRDRTATVQEKLAVLPITLYFEKKIRLELKIGEDVILDKKNLDHKGYFDEKKELLSLFKSFCNAVYKDNQPISTLDKKYIKVEIVKSSGDIDVGYGFALEVDYTRKLDYFNDRRSREMYSGIYIDEKDDFFSSNSEQNNINTHSSEAVGDEMSDDSDSGDDLGMDEEETEGEDDDENNMDNEDEEDFGLGGDDEEDMGGEDDDNSSDDSDDSYGGGSTSSDDSDPIKEINGRQKLSDKYRLLVSEIDNAIKTISSLPLAENVVVKEIMELRSIVQSNVESVYSKPSEESLLKYEMYVARFSQLVNKLKINVKNQKK